MTRRDNEKAKRKLELKVQNEDNIQTERERNVKKERKMQFTG